MISLARRPERRNRMLACLDELAFNYTLFEAVDGKCVSAFFALCVVCVCGRVTLRAYAYSCVLAEAYLGPHTPYKEKFNIFL